MRRKKKYPNEAKPDSLHESMLVGKFINRLMLDGKKSTAERVMYGALDEIKKISAKGGKDEDPVSTLELAIKNVSPMVEIRPRRVGGATYQVPREVSQKRRLSLALRWMVGAARAKKGKPMAKKLADEIILATKNEGTAIKKKLDTHRMAEANRAFAHFAW